MTIESDLEGRVELHHDKKWGTVCDDRWYSWSKQAQIVCRQLGLVGGLSLGNSLEKGKKKSPIWLDDIWCKGTESKLDDCNHRG